MKRFVIFILTISTLEIVARLYAIANGVMPPRTMLNMAVETGLMIVVVVWAVIALMDPKK